MNVKKTMKIIVWIYMQKKIKRLNETTRWGGKKNMALARKLSRWCSDAATKQDKKQTKG